MHARKPQKRIAFVIDRLLGGSGVQTVYQQFLNFCERRSISLSVIGDSPIYPFKHQSIKYRCCTSLPHHLMDWEGPRGLCSRPFIAFSCPEAEKLNKRLSVAVDYLQWHLRHQLSYEKFYQMDSLNVSHWLDELTHELIDFLVFEEIDTIYIATQSFLGFAAKRAASRLRNIRVITAFHTDYPGFFYTRMCEEQPLDARTKLKAIRAAMYKRLATTFLVDNYAIVAPSTLVGDRIDLLLQGTTKCRFSVMPGGVDTEVFFPKKSNLTISREPKRLIYAGRLESEKGMDLLVDIYQRVTDVEWWIAGSGSLEDKLRIKLPSARFLGQLSALELANHFRQADLFISPSLHETFGQAVLEAMACGLPAIVTRFGGPTTFVKNNVNGFVCDPTADSFVAAIRLALSCDPFADMLSDSAVKLSKTYTWDNAFIELNKMLVEV